MGLAQAVQEALLASHCTEAALESFSKSFPGLFLESPVQDDTFLFLLHLGPRGIFNCSYHLAE